MKSVIVVVLRHRYRTYSFEKPTYLLINHQSTHALYSIHAHQKHVQNMDDKQPGMASKHSDKSDTSLPIFFKQQDIEDGEGGRSITCYDVCMACDWKIQ